MIWHSRRGGFPTYHSNDIFFATILLLSHQSWRQTLYLSLSCLVAGVCTCYSSGDLCSWQGKRNHHRRAYWIMRCWDFSNSCHVMQLFSTPLVLFWGFLYRGGAGVKPQSLASTCSKYLKFKAARFTSLWPSQKKASAVVAVFCFSV